MSGLLREIVRVRKIDDRLQSEIARRHERIAMQSLERRHLILRQCSPLFVPSDQFVREMKETFA